nr:hypothetical protein [Tanacetum cinerariifolium]
MLLMQAQENGVTLDEEQLLFITGEQDNVVDDDMGPTAQIVFMANLSFADPVYDEAGPSYDLDVLSEVKENSKKDKIGSKSDKNRKRGDAGKSLKQLQ